MCVRVCVSVCKEVALCRVNIYSHNAHQEFFFSVQEPIAVLNKRKRTRAPCQNKNKIKANTTGPMYRPHSDILEYGRAIKHEAAASTGCKCYHTTL